MKREHAQTLASNYQTPKLPYLCYINLMHLLILIAGAYQPTQRDLFIGNMIGLFLLTLFTIIFGYISLRYIKPTDYINHSRTIRISRFLAPLAGIVLGVIAFIYNDMQFMYLLSFPFFITFVLEAAISLWVRYEGKVYQQKQTNPKTKGGKVGIFLFYISAIGILCSIVVGVKICISSQQYKTRQKNFHKCMVERYGYSGYGDSGPCFQYLK